MTPTISDASTSLRFKSWELRPIERVLMLRGEVAPVGSRAFDVLLTLVGHPGQVVSRNQLLDAAWPGLVVEENNLSVQIANLRKLLGPDAIKTIPGLGYRLSAQPEKSAVPPPAPQATRPVIPTPAARTGNLPATLPPLFGRDDDVAALASLIDNHRVVSAVGAGGIGKTRLAQAAAHALRGAFTDGVWMVELAPVSDPALLPAAVAQALGITLPGHRPAQAEVIASLGDRSLLLLLDNCEHVLDGASAFVQALVDRSANARVLVTSQELLRVPDEQLYRVATLSTPATDDLAAAADSGAVALLMSRVRALRPDFALTAGNIADVADICRRLDGLPLAIELAAARVPLLGLSGVRSRLNERFRVLTGGSRTAPPRHRTLHETMEWSHGLLSSGERAVFRRAGVFAGSFGMAMAQRVLGDAGLDEWAVLEHLGALVDKSLVAVEPGEPPRYRLLESARAYALGKLHEAGETDLSLARHATATLALFDASCDQHWTLTSQARLQLYLPDLDNCRAALDWAARGNAGLHVALAGASAWLWGATGQSVEGMQHGEQALAHVGPATPAALEARLNIELCGLAHYSPGTEKRAAAERAVGLYRALGDRAALYAALGRLAITASLSGDAAVGELATQEMAQLFDPAWPLLARWDLLNARDYVANMLGRYAEGEALAHEEMALAIATGDAAKTLFAMMALEQCASTRGDFAEAVARGRELVARAKRERFAYKLHVYVANLATALVMLGEVDEGLIVAREAAELDSRTGTLWLDLDLFALLTAKRGRMTDAALVIGRAEAVNAWRGSFREPVEQCIRDDVMQRLQAALPKAELDGLLACGAALSDEEATRIALAG